MCSEVLLQMFNDLEAYGTFIAGTFRRLAVDCEKCRWKGSDIIIEKTCVFILKK